MTAPRPAIWKPGIGHNYLFDGAPAMCMCPDCREKVRALRCPVTVGRERCGKYRGHGDFHTRLIDTSFLP